MTTEAGGTRTTKVLAPDPAEMIWTFFTAQASDNDVVTIPGTTSAHYATAVANATAHGGSAALSREEITIETATKLDEVLFQAGNDEYVTGFAISDVDDADDTSGTGTASTSITYYKVTPGPASGAVSSNVSTGGLIVAYFEGTVSSDEAIDFSNIGIDKVYGAIAYRVSGANAFTNSECTVGVSTELQKVKFTEAAQTDVDMRGLVWGIADDASKATNTGTTLTSATGIKLYKISPGPSEVKVLFVKNTEVSTNEGITVTELTEARFAVMHKIASGISTTNAVTVPASATELNMVKVTTTNTDVDVRGIVIGDVKSNAGWS